ncbi:putative transcriptional regulator with C-terminal CBS domains [Thiovulum sp. ES]|nr:putative transcriptional regulator with C-terminal CBS domains [Thiovulum sp. ES]
MEQESLIKKTCKELGITQKELAERIGFSTTSISKWNKKINGIPKNVEKVLNLLVEHELLKKEYELFRQRILR